MKQSPLKARLSEMNAHEFLQAQSDAVLAMTLLAGTIDEVRSRADAAVRALDAVRKEQARRRGVEYVRAPTESLSHYEFMLRAFVKWERKLLQDAVDAGSDVADVSAAA